MVTFPSLATTTCLDMMIGAGNQNEKIVKKFNFFRDRDSNKQISSQVALNMLRLYLRDE